MSSAVCNFATLERAMNATIQTFQSGVPIARIELLDDVQVGAVNAHSGTSLPVAPLLLLEFHGSTASVKEQAETVEAIAGEHGGTGFQWATKPEDRTKLWEARHAAAWANKALRPNGKVWATDVCVPVSRLAECIMETKRDIEQSFIPAPIVGHVGDGNFHLTLVLDPTRPEDVEEANRINDNLVMRALAMEGTCTGEHGVGYGKMKFLTAEHGDAISVMRALKQALDPQNIMNPGKIVAL